MSRRPFFFNKNRNVLVLEWKTKPPKIVGKLVEKLRTSQRNGTVVHKCLTFSELLKSLGNICFLEQLSKKSLGAPVENRVLNCICHRVICCSSLWKTCLPARSTLQEESSTPTRCDHGWKVFYQCRRVDFDKECEFCHEQVCTQIFLK